MEGFKWEFLVDVFYKNRIFEVLVKLVKWVIIIVIGDYVMIVFEF